MIVRSAAHVTCHRTRAKMPRRATMNKIALLNDAFRGTFAGGKVVMTAGVYALPDMVKAEALKKAATFDAFTEDNAPHGEHDFGSFGSAVRISFGKLSITTATGSTVAKTRATPGNPPAS